MNAETPRPHRARARPANEAPEAKAERWRLWQEENKDAIEDYNRWIEEHGLPLDEYRQL